MFMFISFSSFLSLSLSRFFLVVHCFLEKGVRLVFIFFFELETLPFHGQMEILIDHCTRSGSCVLFVRGLASERFYGLERHYGVLYYT